MVKYKDINVSIDITTKKTLVQSLDAVIYSHDSNAVRVIAKISKNGAPLDTDNVSLLLSSCNYSGYVKDAVSIKLDGTIVDDTATFELPNDILSYQGFLRLDFYIDWADGSNDGGQPILFEIKKSTIDAQASTWAVTYISDFEQIKQQVSQAAQDTLNAIDTDKVIAEFEADKQAVKQAKDEAIVEIEARPSELDASIEQANQTIANKVADVTNTGNDAKQTIADTVASVEESQQFSALTQALNHVNQYDTEIAKKADETIVNGQINDLTAQLAEKSSQAALDVEKARITNLETLAAGSTTADAELIDMRVGADGKTYPNAGEAVRKQFTSVVSDVNKIATFLTNYWTLGDISVPIVGAWSFEIVECPVVVPAGITDLGVKLGGISDSIDVHKFYAFLLDENKNVISDGVKYNTFVNGVVIPNGYIVFNVTNIRDTVKYVRIQAQAYAGNTPTTTGNIVYKDIFVYDYNAENSLNLKVKEEALSTNLKSKLNLSANKGALKQDIGTLADGGFIQLCINHVKKNKRIVVSGKIDTFSSIRIGHGTGYYGGAYLEIDATNIKLYKYDTSAILVKTVAHGLAIAENIYVEITNSVSKYGFHATIKIVSNGVVFTQAGAFDFPWIGSNGGVFISSGGTILKNCKIAWSCDDFSAKIYAFGDSYFDYWNPKMADLGHANKFLFDGYGGRRTADAIASFNFCMTYGQPRYVLWCLGMNDPDVGVVEPNWLTAFNTVVNTCKSKDIIPIFCTIPNTPTNDNTYKNAHIKSSGYRYVDIAEFVGSNVTTSWYAGLLGSDNLHPTDLGSYLIAENIIADLADIIFAK